MEFTTAQKTTAAAILAAVAGIVVMMQNCNTGTPVVDPSPSPSAIVSVLPSPVVSASPSVTPSASPSPSPSPSPSVSPSPKPSVAPSASPSPSPTLSPKPSPKPSPSVSPTASPIPSPSPTSSGPSKLSGLWANNGEDKVVQEDLRLTSGKVVTSKAFDGTKVKLVGSKNEVVSFNTILESTAGATAVSVEFKDLTQDVSWLGSFVTTPSKIETTHNDFQNYVGRNIELFHVGYLQIKGLSALSYDTYDERHVPKRMQRPWTGAGTATGTWANRPDANKSYPEIAVPLELKQGFTIAAGKSQAIWADIYIPKTVNAGLYKGTLKVLEGTVVTKQLPVELEVKEITLPDVPSSKTMVFIGDGDLNDRYIGQRWPNDDSLTTKVKNKTFQVAHRHKISMIDSDAEASAWTKDEPRPTWIPRLNGSLFTAVQGYDGPGVGVGNGVYSVGTYSSWKWKSGVTSQIMATRSGNWENWFKTNSPATERFLYLIDESTDYATMKNWATWTKGFLPSFATLPLDHAVDNVPDLNISASWIAQAPTTWQAKFDTAKAAGKKVYLYNGKRPASGSFATEDDGVALRELAWGQYKKKVDRWFFWESTYYNNYQGGTGNTNVFKDAQTFGGKSATLNAIVGETGWNHSNGDGVLFYPGRDKIFPAESFNVDAPFASLRLKHWRRGIQDIDYVVLANAKDPVATQAIVNRMVPKVLWEYGVTDPADPTWVRSDISWSINPDDWEQAKLDLIAIIQK